MLCLLEKTGERISTMISTKHLILPAIFVTGCNSSSTSKKISEPPLRDGNELGSTLIAHYDNFPSLSANGEQLVFISGKGAPANSGASIAYKSTWTSGNAPATPSELTPNDDLGSENQAWISPDGQWSVVLATSNNQSDLYLQGFSGGNATAITNDTALESHVEFSPDSKLILWRSFDAENSQWQIKVAEIGDGSAGQFSTPLTIGTSNVTNCDFGAFLETGDSSYKVAFGQYAHPETGNFDDLSRDLYTLSGSTYAALQSASASLLVENQPTDLNIFPASTTSHFYFSKLNLGNDDRKSSQSGNKVEDNPTQKTIDSEINKLAISDGSEANFDVPPGFRPTSLDAGDSTLFWTTLDHYLCDEASKVTYGNLLYVAPTDLSTFNAIVPRYIEKTSKWELATSICHPNSDDSVGLIDNKIDYVRVTATSKSDSYRLAYVSTFTSTKDSECNLKSGDKEIRLVEFSGGQATFYSVWEEENREDIEDTKRDTPCE